MRIYRLGDGTPEIAIVGAIHGDEPCGARAIERLVRDDPAVERPVKLVVANEEALARGVRYVDVDLNRAFAEDVDESAHEYRLAQKLTPELEGCLVLSIHSTQSHPEPFGLVNGLDGPISAICPRLSITALVDVDTEEGRLFALEATDLIEVEAGLQGTDEAVENAYRLAREFLTATGALPGKTTARELPVFRLDERLEKPPAEQYEVYVENFSEVNEGEVFASADEERLVAPRPFYPVLVSANGYDTIFGYAGHLVGALETTGVQGRI